MEQKFPNLRIIGVHHGYFSTEDEKNIVEEIRSLNADVLLVGLGFPRQEKFIYRYRNELGAKISVGVGGSLDVMAGTVKRAPVAFQKLGLEWFYRLLCQPTRIGRMIKLPQFAIKVVARKLSRKKGKKGGIV